MSCASKSLILSFLFAFSTYLGIGQSNPTEQSFTLVPGQVFETIIESGFREARPILNQLFDFGIVNMVDGGFDQTSESNKTMISFKVNEDFVGKSTSLIVEYTAGPMEFSPLNYTTLHFKVVHTHIETKHDYKSVEVGESDVVVNVLDNDISSHTGLAVSDIAYQSGNIDARIEDNRIVFNTTNDRGGMAYVNYIATNAEGASALGTLTICVLNTNNIATEATLQYVTSLESPLVILLPISDLEFEGDGPSLGSAEFIGDDVIEYIPTTRRAGVDRFTVRSGDITRNIEIRLYQPNTDDGSVKDDKVHTAVNSPIQFNIFDNDIFSSEDEPNLESISEGDGLTYLGGGEVYFEPNPGYIGTKHFEYVIDKGISSEIGKIKVVVGGFFPEPLSTYKFVTKKNTPFVISYDIPIDDYAFGALSVPTFGSLAFLNTGGDTYDCGEFFGEELIVYTPSNDFIGKETMSLVYEVNDYEQEIQIEIEVIDSDDCGCAGADCVWPGDTNNDGKVFITDLLTLGNNFGLIGASREENEWIGNDGDDWGLTQTNNDIDQKYVDANGDGVININDVNLIKENYHKYHNLVASEILTIKDYPFYIVPSSTQIDSGDWLELDILVGDQDNPVLDIHGLAYTLHIDPAVYDSSSLEVQYFDTPWFGANSPTIHMHVQPIDGRVDIGSTRTTGNTVSGKGIIHKLGIIIEEDVDGLDPGQDKIDIPITVSNISFTNGAGERVQIGDVETQVTLDLTDNVEEIIPEAKETDLFMFPNPTANTLNLHLNGRDVIQSVSIFDLSGKIMYTSQNQNTDKLLLDVSDYNEGIYVTHVTTATTVISKRFNVAKN